MKQLIVSLLLISNVFCAPSKPRPKEKTQSMPEYEKEFQTGYSYQTQSLWQDAIDHYKKALDLNPRYQEAYNNQGYCYKMIAKDYLSLSGESYKMAINLNPNFVSALEYQGTYFIMNSQLSQAFANFRRLQSLAAKEEAKDLQEAINEVLVQAKAILKTYQP